MRLLTIFLIASALCMASITADAGRGAEFFAKQKCDTCHSVGSAVHAAQPGTAPDLSLRADREYTPASLASRMWNHAPAMWSAIERKNIQMPTVSEQDAADLFAFFYAARYFEKTGDAGRGKRVFTAKGCAQCHALTAGASSVGPPVSEWQGLTDPVALVQAMWNHIPQMKEATAQKKISWPELTSQDLSDLMVYLQNLPSMRGKQYQFKVAGAQTGAELFKSKGCADCHQGANALEKKLSDQTLTEIAADMWNHGPKMSQVKAQFSEGEMRSLLAYVWGNQFFGPRGNPSHGRRVFESKQCATCHTGGGAPQIAGTPGFSNVTLVSALWKHGPRMLQQMKQKNINWPTLTPSQMSDLVAYLSSPESK